LFEIAGALGTSLTLNEATEKRTFSHFVRVLIELDLTSDLRERILVERKDFYFYMDVEYEKLPLSITHVRLLDTLLRTTIIRFLQKWNMLNLVVQLLRR